MITSKHAFFTLASIFAINTMAQELIIEDKGFRLSVDEVSKNFSLMRQTPSEELLINYIGKINSGVSKEDTLEIAQNILKVSSCFKIDPWILTGLIQKESTFNKNAVSPTNAAGLTQFTGIGFKEVNDQLGFRGKEGASEGAIFYFNTKILECVDPNWVHLWTKLALPEDHPDFYNVSKEEIKKDIQLSVTYGAVLLKTYVAFVDSKNSESAITASMSDTYFQALQMYNGEPGDAKVKYAKNIFQNLKNLYPIPVNFDFLKD